MLVGEVFARMGLDSTNYEKELGRLEGVTNRQATTLGTVFKGAFSVALGIGVFEAVRRGLGKLTGTVISYNAQMQQAQIGFTTMLGSADRAAVFLDDLAAFAAKTPFEFPELLDASKRMLAYGFEAGRVLPIMEAVGNATAGLGMGADGINRIILALGQMRAKGKLSGEEMRQLTEAGIPAWEMLANAMGKTTAEIMDMQQKGLIPADKAIDMIIEGMNKKFPDMMKNMENTWEGVTSTIKDVWNMTIGAIGENLFKGLLSWLQGVRDFATDFYAVFRKQGLQQAIQQSFGPEIAALVSILTAVMRGFAAIVRTVTGFIQQYGTQLKFVVTVMATYYTLTKALTVAQWALVAATAAEKGQLLAKIPILNVVGTAMGIYRVQMALAAQQGMVLTGVVARLRVALFSLWSALGPIGWLILGISAAAGIGIHMWGNYTKSLQEAESLGFGDFRKAQEGISSSTEDSSGALEDQADAMKKAGKAAAKNLQPFDEINQLQKDAAGAGSDLADALSIGDISMGAMDLPSLDAGMGLTGDLEQAKPTISGFWEWIKQGAGSIWDDWSNYVQSWGWVDKLSDWIVDTFYDAEKGVWSLKRTWQKWSDYVQSWGWVQGLTDWIVGVLKKWGDFKASAGETWENIKNFIKTKWNDLSTGAKSTWANIKDTVQTSWNNLKKDAPAAWENIKNTISTKANNTRDALTKTWTEISKRTADAWASIKASTSTAWDNIKTYLGQTWSGIQANMGNALTNIRNIVTNAWNNLRSTTQTVWGNIKNAITSPIESAKRTVLNIIDNIKNAFANMRITIPKPKLPHISVSTKTKKIGNISIPYPDFDINWYAQGAVFSGPSVIGVGEAGAEAVLPLERNTGWMDTLAAKIATSIPGGAGGDIYVYVGNEQVDAYVYRSQDRRNIKSNGR